MNFSEEYIDEPEEKQELYEHHKILVDKGQGMLRIDKFLMYKIVNISRTKIQNACDTESVIVNGKPVKSNYKVKPYDEISVVFPDPPKITDNLPEDIPLNIVYEDQDILIINKEAGLVVHPAYGNYTGTLINALLFHFENLPLNNGQESRPGLIHRIDKDTSGLMIIAKTEFAMTFLSKQFFDHTISRKYYALVWGDMKEETGTISGYIGRSLKDRKVMQIFKEPEHGKWAVTHWKVLERFYFATLVECELETGRTHQIRASMQHIGHPIFADSTYGGMRIVKGMGLPKFEHFAENCLTAMQRQSLHAKTLGFIHPTTREFMLFDSELATDLANVLNKFRNFSETYRK
ncbi:MAG: RluA family pseudouridine synthase [Bacteroidota bacterium]|jgi:23S rRNA pseudouridine1911/1915/1917 synthase